MNSQQITELLRNGEFDAIVQLLGTMRTYIDMLQDNVSALKQEVVGTNDVVSLPSANGVLHSPSRTDATTGESREKLLGTYLLGDQIDPNQTQGNSRPGVLIVGPTSEILIDYLPTKANHALPKVYLDNMLRPVNKAILSLATAIGRKVITAYYFNSGSSQVALRQADFVSGISNHIDYFSFEASLSNRMAFLKSGVYLLLIYLTATVNDSGSSNGLVVNLNGDEIGQINLNSGSGPLFFPIYVNAQDVLSWQSSGNISNISFGMSFVRLGDQ